MADFLTLPAAGSRIAIDEVADRNYQLVKLTFGADGVATMVSGVDGLPVQILGSVSTGGLTDGQLRAAPVPVTVSDGSGPLTVDGTVAITGSVAVTGTFWQATQPVSGTVAVSNLPGTQAVSGPLTDAQLRASAVPVTISGAVGVTGTFWQATQPVSAASLPLPAGAATETSLAILADATKLEDTPGVSGDRGMLILAQRFDTDAPTAGTDGDYTVIKCDEAGRLKVAVQPGGYPLVTGTITNATSTVPINVGRVSNVMVYVAGTFAGVNFTFEGSLNSTNGTDGNWFGIQAVRTNANTIETASGVIAAAPAYGWELSVNGLNWFRVRATAWVSGTATIQIQPGAYATEPIPAAQISGTQPVSGTVTANIGTGALAAGANAIGDVGLQLRANATGAASIHHIVSAGSTNAAVIKAGAGRVAGWCLSNTSAAWRYVKLHNTTVAPTVGTTAVVLTIGIPPGNKAECAHSVGLGFATGISRSIVAGAADNDATAVALTDVVGDIFFA